MSRSCRNTSPRASIGPAFRSRQTPDATSAPGRPPGIEPHRAYGPRHQRLAADLISNLSENISRISGHKLRIGRHKPFHEHARPGAGSRLLFRLRIGLF